MHPRRRPRRGLAAALPTLLLLASGLLAVSAVPAAAGGPLRVTDDVAECESSPSADARAATFTVTSAAPSGGRHAVTTDLQVRTGGRWSTLPPVAGFGTTERSTLGVARFVVRHRVTALVPGRAYRVRARVLWRSETGGTLRRTSTSEACRQRERRPDLTAAGLTALGGGAFLADVDVTRGPALRGAPAWVADVDGVEVARGALSRTSGRQRIVIGPSACPAGGGTLRFRLDPLDLVDERRETDGEATVPCLAAPGTAGTLGSP